MLDSNSRARGCSRDTPAFCSIYPFDCFHLAAAPRSKIRSVPVSETAGMETATKRTAIRTLIKAPAVTCRLRKRWRWRPVAWSRNRSSRVSPSTLRLFIKKWGRRCWEGRPFAFISTSFLCGHDTSLVFVCSSLESSLHVPFRFMAFLFARKLSILLLCSKFKKSSSPCGLN